MATLSAAIMAHPVRRQSAHSVQVALGQSVPISFDEVETPSKDPMQRWRVARRAWEMHRPSAQWHIVVQDDVMVSRNMLPALAKALDQFRQGDGLVSAYTGTGRPDQQNVRRALAAAERKGHAWMSTRSLNWGPAICAPVHTIPGMLEWVEERVKRFSPPRSNYDYLVGCYYRDVMKWRTWYTVPSLVEHKDLPSLVGHDYGPKRVAHRFHEGDALEIDWTRTPEGGLNHRLS